ncbi:MAG: SEC-C domain-containing protein [Fibrobacterota bacterium]
MLGRNDPCPCGSGNKYKKCCMAADQKSDAATASANELPDYVNGRQVEQLMESAPKWMPEETGRFFDSVIDDPEVRQGLARFGEANPEELSGLLVGVQECMLAELARCGLAQRFGHRLSREQLAYVQELALQPLRLWEVQSVSVGKFIGLVPLNSPRGDLIEVAEISASTQVLHFDVLAARVVYDAAKPTVSSIFRADRKEAKQLLAQFRSTSKSESALREAALALEREFLRQFLRKVAIPPEIRIVDGASRAPLELVTDRFTVLDPKVIRRTLFGIKDIEPMNDFQTEWNRVQTTNTGVIRSLAKLTLDGDVLILESRSRPAAADNRKWLKAHVGDLIRFRSRKIVDMTQELGKTGVAGSGSEAGPLPMTPEVIDAVYRSTYREWPDTPISVLDNKSPRQCARSAKGRETVLDWVRECQLNETRMAKFQKRDPVDLSWLLTTVGIDSADL